MQIADNLLRRQVSTGTYIRAPGRLENRTAGYVSRGFRSGRWRPSVEHLRSLPPGEQQAAKEKLPFVTWAGVFDYRSNDRLAQHSGLIGIDLDNLTPKQQDRVIQTAVVDRFCFLAYRSARLNGIWLVFNVPPVDSDEDHKEIFRQVSEHVRSVYGHKPDPKCKDVCRASFVTWDADMWSHPTAKVFPIQWAQREICQPSTFVAPPPALPSSAEKLPRRTGKPLSKGQASSVRHLGLHSGPCVLKSDGQTVFTHKSLLGLARRLALQIAKGRFPGVDVELLLDEAFGGWLLHVNRRQRRLRGRPSEYRKELSEIFRSVWRGKGLKDAATKWTKWLAHPKFPRNGTSREKVMFAIRCHCKKHKTDEFFLSYRDAGLIVGHNHAAAGKMLNRLIRDGFLALRKRYLLKRHARHYRLMRR